MKILFTISGRLLVCCALLFLLRPSLAKAQVPAWQRALSSTNNSTTTGSAQSYSTAIDAAGNVVVVGYFFGQVSFGSTALVSAGSSDIFLAKWNTASGSWAWAYRGGGPNTEYGWDVAINGSSIYVTGAFASNSGAIIAGIPLAGAGGTDAFLAKYTDNGTSASGIWAVSGGGRTADESRSVAVNGNNIYITGYFSNGFMSNVRIAGTLLSSNVVDVNMFVAKYVDNGGSVSDGWALSDGGDEEDRGYGIAVSGTSVYVTGDFYTSTNVRFGGTSLNGNGRRDVFLAKYTDNGSSPARVWGVSGGGTDEDTGLGVAVSGNNVYMTGSIISGSNAVVTGVNIPGAGNADMFLAKYTDNGATVTNGWAVSGGGTGGDAGRNVVAQGSSIYVCGSIASSSGAVVAGASLPGAGSFDVLVAKYTDNGTSATGVWAKTGGGPGSDFGWGLDVRGSVVAVAGIATAPATFGSTTLNQSLAANMAFAAQLVDTPAPVLGGIAPASAVVGSTVVLTGTGLGGTTSVTFSGPAGPVTVTTGFTVNAAGTQITVVVPAGAGTGPVTVTANTLTSNGTGLTVVQLAVVTAVAVPADGTYRAGAAAPFQELVFTLTFSQTVAVTGTPQLGLVVGTTLRQADYLSGSGTAALVFRYLPQVTDLDTDGIDVGRLTLNGGTISGNGVAGSLALPALPSTAGVLVGGPLATASARLPVLTVFPNPTTGALTIHLPAQAGAALGQATLVNALGQVVQAHQFQLDAQGAAQLNMTGLPPGLYRLRLSVGGQQASRSITVQ